MAASFLYTFFKILVILVTNVSSSVVLQNFTAVPQLKDKIFTEEILGQFSAISKLSCAIECKEQCSCFAYNREEGICRLQQECNELSATDIAIGWNYYRTVTDSCSVIDLAADCLELYSDACHRSSGVYTIRSHDGEARQVYCDMETDGGGWTVILKREDGSVNFSRNWGDYKYGFGNASTEYWIGNEMMHNLSASRLYVMITHINGSIFYQTYGHFYVASEATGYKLYFGEQSGTMGNAFMYGSSATQLHSKEFSTVDRDQDRNADINCAALSGGAGWWYNSCHRALLTGPYGTTEWTHPWSPVFEDGTQIKAVRMMMKRK